MSLIFKFVRRQARFRAPLLASLFLPLVSCNNSDLLDSTTDSEVADAAPTSGAETEPSFASAYAGGIPFGTFRLPTYEFGARYNGAMRNIYPEHLLRELRAIKARGGKVVLMFAGHERHYKDRRSHHFSLTKWKARIDRFKKVNFSSYIKDGTIIGHYLIDEPNDPANWGRRPVPPATLEEMAKYSKRHWPGMVTIVRTRPEYLVNYRGRYRYLDAAWAQYSYHRWPNTREFINSNVAKARSKGLALVVGLNVINGGSRRRSAMTANQVRTFGSVLLESSYPCAFISWQYRDYYMKNRGVQQAMAHLRTKARSRGFKTCRGGGRAGGDGGDDD
jgi:hypothetical protein